MLSFKCLPFGWKYSPILCQKVLEHLVEEIGLVRVLVLIYIDDVHIVGRGKAWPPMHSPPSTSFPHPGPRPCQATMSA